jgi:ABC-type amino acid transport substrate-binding protein
VPVSDFEQIIPMLLRGEGDVISGIVDTPARRERISFTREVFPLRHMVVTRRPRGPVGDVGTLHELRVGVIPGTSWEAVAIAAGVPLENRVSFKDADALLAGLREGEADAVVMALLDYALARKRDPDLVAGTFIGAKASAALGVSPDAVTLRRALDEYLEITRQGRHHLMMKYLDEGALSLIALARRD